MERDILYSGKEQGMQIQSFKVFVDLVECGSFSAAATANGITQSAVSQQMQALEDRFGTPLLERGGRLIKLTPEGEAFLSASREILRRLERLETTMERLRSSITGVLRISVIPSIGLHELPSYLQVFRAQYPGVEAVVDYERASRVYAAVQQNEADLGLVAYPEKKRGLEMVTFWRDRLIVVCRPGHPLAHYKKLPLRKLHGEKFAAFTSDLPTRKFLDKQFRSAGVRIRFALESDHVETVKRVVEKEDLLAVLPATSVRAEVRSGTLCQAVVADHEWWRPLGVVLKKGREQSPRVREFVALLTEFDLGGEGEGSLKSLPHD
jgi:DNA-binding transcriptional LysR family regulator